MALQKSQQLSSGVEVSYHRITSIHMRIGQACHIEVSAYIDEQAWLDGKAPVSQSIVRLEVDGDLAQAMENAVASAYVKLNK